MTIGALVDGFVKGCIMMPGACPVMPSRVRSAPHAALSASLWLRVSATQLPAVVPAGAYPIRLEWLQPAEGATLRLWVSRESPKSPQKRGPSQHQRVIDLSLGAVFGAFTSLLVAVIFTDGVTQMVEQVSWKIEHPTKHPSCDEPGWYDEVVPSDAQAWSELYEGNERVLRSTSLMRDGDSNTAWLGRDSVDPQRNLVAFSFKGGPELAFACVQNGAVANVNTYFGNGRVKDYRLEGCGDDRIGTFPDSAGTLTSWDYSEARRWQQVDLDCETDSLVLQILSTQAQDRSIQGHVGDTVSISEIRFFARP